MQSRDAAGVSVALLLSPEAVAESRDAARFGRSVGGRGKTTLADSCAAGAAGQAAVRAVVCRQSLSRLWAALVRRHSDRAADLPRRRKRSMRRLNLVSAKIGSIIVWRLA